MEKHFASRLIKNCRPCFANVCQTGQQKAAVPIHGTADNLPLTQQRGVRFCPRTLPDRREASSQPANCSAILLARDPGNTFPTSHPAFSHAKACNDRFSPHGAAPRFRWSSRTQRRTHGAHPIQEHPHSFQPRPDPRRGLCGSAATLRQSYAIVRNF